MKVQATKATDQVQSTKQVGFPGRERVRFGDSIAQSQTKVAKTGVLNDALASPYAGEQGSTNGGVYLDPVAILLYLLNREERVAETTQQATGDAIQGQIKGIQTMAAQEAKALITQGEKMQSKAMAGMWTSLAGVGMSLVSIGGSVGSAAYFSKKLSNVDKELQAAKAEASGIKVQMEGENAVPMQNLERNDDDLEIVAGEHDLNDNQLAEQNLTKTKETVGQKMARESRESARTKANKTWDSANSALQGVGTLGQAGPQAVNAAVTAPMELQIKTAEATQTRAQATRTVIQSVFQLVQEVYSKSASRQEQFADMVAQAGQRFAQAQSA